MLAQSMADNPHLNEVTAAFGPLQPPAQFVPPNVDFLVLLFTNRCGSNFLAQVLASTQIFNEAGEFFNGDTIVSHLRANGLRSVAEYVRLLPDLVGRRDRIAVKLGVEHLDLLNRAGLLAALLPRMRFILLERQDRLGQAISRAIAAQNLRWTSEQPGRMEDDQLVYDRGWIDRQMDLVATGNRLLFHFIRDARLAPLHFLYEKLVADPQAHLDQVAAWLPLPGLRMNPDLIRLRPQANEVNAAWRARYLAGG
jgi:LPS sulfotransferase NodH